MRTCATCGGESSGPSAWKEKPSTFLVLTQDDDIAVANQRAAAERTGGVVEIETNHYAHLERPDLVAAALVDIAANLVPGRPTADRPVTG